MTIEYKSGHQIVRRIKLSRESASATFATFLALRNGTVTMRAKWTVPKANSNAHTNNNKRTHCLCLTFFPFSLVCYQSQSESLESTTQKLRGDSAFEVRVFFSFYITTIKHFIFILAFLFFSLLFFLISSCIWGKNFDITTIKPFTFIAHAHHIHVHACFFFLLVFLISSLFIFLTKLYRVYGTT